MYAVLVVKIVVMIVENRGSMGLQGLSVSRLGIDRKGAIVELRQVNIL